MTRRHPLQHVHACTECQRPFFICCERDCDLAPDVCPACEMDRQDAYFSQPELPIRTADAALQETH